MGAVVAITRSDLTAGALRAAASREREGAAARRMLAIALVLEGAGRKTAAEACGMDRQTLRDWATPTVSPRSPPDLGQRLLLRAVGIRAQP
jgi:hypothetical protein